MVGIHLQLDGTASALPRDVDGSAKERLPHAPVPMLGADEEFVEPGDQAAMLQGPRVGQDRHADGLGIMGDQDGATSFVGDQGSDPLGQLVEVEGDPVLLKLGGQERDHRLRVHAVRHVDSHDQRYDFATFITELIPLGPGGQSPQVIVFWVVPQYTLSSSRAGPVAARQPVEVVRVHSEGGDRPLQQSSPITNDGD